MDNHTYTANDHFRVAQLFRRLTNAGGGPANPTLPPVQCFHTYHSPSNDDDDARPQQVIVSVRLDRSNVSV